MTPELDDNEDTGIGGAGWAAMAVLVAVGLVLGGMVAGAFMRSLP